MSIGNSMKNIEYGFLYLLIRVAMLQPFYCGVIVGRYLPQRNGDQQPVDDGTIVL